MDAENKALKKDSAGIKEMASPVETTKKVQSKQLITKSTKDIFLTRLSNHRFQKKYKVKEKDSSPT